MSLWVRVYCVLFTSLYISFVSLRHSVNSIMVLRFFFNVFCMFYHFWPMFTLLFNDCVVMTLFCYCHRHYNILIVIVIIITRNNVSNLKRENFSFVLFLISLLEQCSLFLLHIIKVSGFWSFLCEKTKRASQNYRKPIEPSGQNTIRNKYSGMQI